MRGGRPLSEHAVQEITQRYARIGGGSPLRRITEQQACGLAARLAVPVVVGMRNWKPFIAEALASLPAMLEWLVVICLAPQNSRTSVGLYRQHLERALDASPARPQVRPRVKFVESWYDHPRLIQAFAEKVRAGLAATEAGVDGEIPVILTAHSVPESTVAGGDPYTTQVEQTAALVAAAARLATGAPLTRARG